MTAAAGGFTHRRSPGVSLPPYDQANLALHVGDDPASVQENRRRFAARRDAAPEDVAWMSQVHGRDVVRVDAAPAEPPTADALVTATPGVVLAVLVADCVPVLLLGERAVGVVHAGRRGAAAGVLPAALEAMADLGEPAPLVRLGPAVCGACYEVPADLAAEVEATLPGSRTATRQGTAGLDLRAGLARQATERGLAVETSATCTAESPHLYSYRRDGRTGRQAGWAVLAPGSPA